MIHRLYFLVHPKLGVWFSPPAKNRTDTWVAACQWDMVMGGSTTHLTNNAVGEWKKAMQSGGWRIEKCALLVPVEKQ